MFKNRSHQKELIDGDQIPDTDLEVNLDELHLVNRFLGGYANTFNALKNIDSSQKTIVDIGSGGGNMAIKISAWSRKHHKQMTVVGLDIKPYCIVRSQKLAKGMDVQFVETDYRNVFDAIPNVKIIHACLFTHHLGEAEIVELINICKQNNATLIVNDLIRSALAYWGIKILTSLFSNSYLVKNDAPLSVLRGFKKLEWIKLIEASEATKYTIKNRWAFRHQVVIYG